MNADVKRWTILGATQPYWSVCIDPRHRAGRLSAQDVHSFFQAGELEVAQTIADVRRLKGAEFRPRHSVDFGCGVARLTIPISRESSRATGVDLSPTMLAEARRNCAERGIANVQFLTTQEFLADPAWTFDFVHSYIVFQHINPRDGLWLTNHLLQRLEPGGVGALHYTFARRASLFRRAVNRLRRWIPPFDMAVKAALRKPVFEPSIPMYEYSMAKLLTLLQSHRCENLSVSLTDHGGHLGAKLTFVKPA